MSKTQEESQLEQEVPEIMLLPVGDPRFAMPLRDATGKCPLRKGVHGICNLSAFSASVLTDPPRPQLLVL